MTVDLLLQAVLQYGIPGGLAIWLVWQLVNANRSLGKVIEKKDEQYSAMVATHAKEQAQNTVLVTQALTNNTNGIREHRKTMEKLAERIDLMLEIAPNRRDR